MGGLRDHVRPRALVLGKKSGKADEMRKETGLRRNRAL